MAQKQNYLLQRHLPGGGQTLHGGGQELQPLLLTAEPQFTLPVPFCFYFFEKMLKKFDVVLVGEQGGQVLVEEIIGRKTGIAEKGRTGLENTLLRVRPGRAPYS